MQRISATTVSPQSCTVESNKYLEQIVVDCLRTVTWARGVSRRSSNSRARCWSWRESRRSASGRRCFPPTPPPTASRLYKPQLQNSYRGEEEQLRPVNREQLFHKYKNSGEEGKTPARDTWEPSETAAFTVFYWALLYRKHVKFMSGGQNPVKICHIFCFSTIGRISRVMIHWRG